VDEVADPPGLQLTDVLAWLAGEGIDLPAPVRATLFEGGRSNVTYRLTGADGSSVVVRRPPLGNVMPTAHNMAREHQVLTGLTRVDFPAPRPLALCEDESVTGAPFLVMEFVDGRIVATSRQAAQMDPAARGRISQALVTTLARLHALDMTVAGLAELGRPHGYLPRQLSRWGKQWDLTRTRDLASMGDLHDAIAARLARVPGDLPWSLVHGDYRLDNLILDPVDDSVRAVLDWEMSTLGDPLTDLALTLVYWSEPNDNRRHDVPVALNLTDGTGFWGRAQLIDAYAAASGRTLDHLDVCTALACYKLAVITESIHARTLIGKQLGASARDTHAMGVATEALADLGLAVIASGTVAGLAS
jgi:aminoglycoside phosphotransferase (APT) family kinase protein